MDVTFRPFEIGDYDAVRALWEASPGVGLSAADSRDGIAAFLNRNPGLSLLAVVEGAIVGTVMIGQDGRRGYLHHLAVSGSMRRQGLGRRLVREALEGLALIGIEKCHLFTYADNAAGRAFWAAIGAEERVDLSAFSLAT
jgi:ribosomal protein S18 acetylase RimI-like enzyme